MHASIHHCVHTCVRARACAFFAIVCVCLCAPPPAVRVRTVHLPRMRASVLMRCFVPARVPSRRSASQHDAISQSHDGEWGWRPHSTLRPPAASSTSWNAATTARSPSSEDRAPPALPCVPTVIHRVSSLVPLIPFLPSPASSTTWRAATRLVPSRSFAGPGPVRPPARRRISPVRRVRARAARRCARRATWAHARIAAVIWAGNAQTTAVSITPKGGNRKGGNRNRSAVSPPETASGCLGGQRRLLRAGPPRTPGGAGLPETSHSDRFPNAGTGGGSGIVRRRRVVSASQTRAPRSMRDRPGDSWGALPDMAPAARPRARVTRTGSRPQAHPSQAEPP